MAIAMGAKPPPPLPGPVKSGVLRGF